jgi:hypothetical protein
VDKPKSFQLVVLCVDKPCKGLFLVIEHAAVVTLKIEGPRSIAPLIYYRPRASFLVSVADQCTDLTARSPPCRDGGAEEREELRHENGSVTSRAGDVAGSR